MTSVVLLHADRALGERLGASIAATPGLVLRGVADGLPALHMLLAQGMPDVLVIDLMLRPGQVHAVLAQLRADGQAGKPLILALAMSGDDPRLMEALCLGADGYFVHSRSALSLPAAIEQLEQGVCTMSPQVARALQRQLDDLGGAVARSAADAPSWLSAVDERVLRWTAEGYLVDEVARALSISAHAVGLRMRHIVRKVQLERRARSRLAVAA